MFQLIAAYNLEKRYRSPAGGVTDALRGASFHVREGEVFGMLGLNGAGKTTTLRILLGLIRPSAGRLLVMGEESVSDQVRARIGYVPEMAEFPRGLTPATLLNFAASLRGVPYAQREDRVKDLMMMTEIDYTSRQSARELSRGQKQRLSLALALIDSPRLLILDEPTAGFDPLARSWFKRTLAGLKRQGVTVLLSTHLLSEIEEVADRACILHAGRTLAEGTLDELRLQAQSAPTLEQAFITLVEAHRGGEDLEHRPGYRR